MTNRTETKELYFIRTSIDALTLTYKLCEERSDASENPRYSLLVAVDDFGNTEEKFIPYLTDSKLEAERLLEIICSGQVTPCTLCDILEDIRE
ncbi:MAG: hypothetical protein E7672_02850 [Ruminococcaceae bacterium]|nr:hypothetical protein [Oscillospiraceae bacterium]